MSDSLLSLMFPLHSIDKLASCSTDLTRYLTESNSRSIKKSLIFFGENSIYKNSLLFQACLSSALSKKESVYICKEQFQTLPLFVHNMPKPDSGDILKLIKFKYLKNSEELIEYFSAIHLEKNLPGIIIIEDLMDYIDIQKYEQEIDCMRHCTAICAHLKSALNFINTKTNCVSIVATRQVEKDNFLKIYFNSICYLKTIEKDLSYEIAFNTVEDARNINLIFQIKDSSLVLNNFKCFDKNKLVIN